MNHTLHLTFFPQHKLPVAFCISKRKSGRQLQGRQTWLVSCLTPALAKRLHPGEGNGNPLQFRGATGEGKGYRLQYSAWRIPWPVYSPWGPKELDTTEQLSPSLLFPPNLCLYMCLVWVHKAPRFLAPNRRTKLSLRIYYSISAASSLCLPISVQFSRSVVSASL